jgi:hypothetical protein
MDDVAEQSPRPGPLWERRIAIVILLAIVIAGAFGVFGVHSRTTTTTGTDGYTLEVTYPQTARSGLDVPWRVTVHQADQLPPQLTIAVTASYFGMFESQAFYPEPDSMTRDDKWLYFTFETESDSDTFVLDADTYVQPSSQIGHKAHVQLIVNDETVAQTEIRTWLVP